MAHCHLEAIPSSALSVECMDFTLIPLEDAAKSENFCTQSKIV